MSFEDRKYDHESKHKKRSKSRQVLPKKLFVCEDDEVQLKIAIDIWPPPCIQWQVLRKGRKHCERVCWEDLDGETNICLIFKARLKDNENKYRAIVSTKCNCYVTNKTKLKIGFIELVKNPISICFDEGETATFIAEAKGRPEPTIQWQVSTNQGQTWIDIPGENSEILSFIMMAGQEGNLYRAVFQNKCGQVISNPAELLPSASLIIDDGTWDISIGFANAQQWLWLNRFTPSAFPFILEEIQVYFSNILRVQVGDPIDLYIWENKTGSPNPGVGAVFRKSLTGQTVNVLNAFNSYPLPSPVFFNGPGDILIGVVNRLPLNDPRYVLGYIPAALDETITEMRSWIGFNYPGLIAPNPPSLPAPSWRLIDDFDFPGNWMIRGFGCGPVPGIQVQLLPSSLPQRNQLNDPNLISSK